MSAKLTWHKVGNRVFSNVGGRGRVRYGEPWWRIYASLARVICDSSLPDQRLFVDFRLVARHQRTSVSLSSASRHVTRLLLIYLSLQSSLGATEVRSAAENWRIQAIATSIISLHACERVVYLRSRPSCAVGRSVIYYVIKYGRWRFVARAVDTYYILARVTGSRQHEGTSLNLATRRARRQRQRHVTLDITLRDSLLSCTLSRARASSYLLTDLRSAGPARQAV